MEFELEFLELERRKVDALEKIAESLNLISMSQASNNMHNILNAFPRDIHITTEGSDEDGSKA